MRQSNTAGRGFAAASSNENLDEAWADALADVPEEAAGILYEANRARQDARIKARLGWGA